MLTPENINVMKKLMAEMKTAERELYRPREHVVAFSVCHSVRFSLTSMMRLFLSSRGEYLTNDLTLAELYAQCCRIDPDFEKLNFNEIFCGELTQKESKNKFCYPVHKVNDCFEVAKQLTGLLQKKLNVNEN